jgi:hypothetical protein
MILMVIPRLLFGSEVQSVSAYQQVRDLRVVLRHRLSPPRKCRR